jgi:hypothetical protein
MSRLDKIRERLPQSKSTLEADKISLQSSLHKSSSTSTTNSPSPALSSEAETDRRINLVKQFLKENEGIRMMWLNAYWALHFVVFASSLYLLLVHFENPYMGDGALYFHLKVE